MDLDLTGIIIIIFVQMEVPVVDLLGKQEIQISVMVEVEVHKMRQVSVQIYLSSLQEDDIHE